jgi:hypothetical protein
MHLGDLRALLTTAEDGHQDQARCAGAGQAGAALTAGQHHAPREQPECPFGVKFWVTL